MKIFYHKDGDFPVEVEVDRLRVRSGDGEEVVFAEELVGRLVVTVPPAEYTSKASEERISREER